MTGLFRIIHLHLVDLYGKCQQILPYKDPTSMENDFIWPLWFLVCLQLLFLGFVTDFRPGIRDGTLGVQEDHWLEKIWVNVIPCDHSVWELWIWVSQNPKNIQTKTMDGVNEHRLGWNKTYVTLPWSFFFSEFTPEKSRYRAPVKGWVLFPPNIRAFQG